MTMTMTVMVDMDDENASPSNVTGHRERNISNIIRFLLSNPTNRTAALPILLLLLLLLEAGWLADLPCHRLTAPTAPPWQNKVHGRVSQKRKKTYRFFSYLPPISVRPRAFVRVFLIVYADK